MMLSATKGTRVRTKLKAVDLFCGCGGLSLGIKLSGVCRTVLAVDNWEYAVECYKKNVGKYVKQVDLSDPSEIISTIEDKQPDIITGGTPCQDFSHAGERVEGERSKLTMSFASIVESVKPTWFLLENVPTIQKSKVYKNAREVFKKSGYGLTEIVLNAAHYDVPQARKRFFCIGKLGEEDGFLTKDIVLASSIEPLTVRKYYKKLKIPIDYEYYYIHPRNYDRRGIYSIDEPAPTLRGQSRPLPGNYKRHRRDVDCGKANPVVLSYKQRAMLQTFPRNFKFPEASAAIQYQLIGNAVPVNLASILFNIIYSYDKYSKSNCLESS